eukprot:g13513.t1 g13513   contig8:843785-844393(+)
MSSPPLHSGGTSSSFTRSSSTDIPLRRWLPSALASISSSAPDNSFNCNHGNRNHNNGEAVSSERFLLPALKVAHSLAGQIWNLEERAVACHDHTATAAVTGAATGAAGAGGGGHALPQPGGDWAANIVIHLSEGRTNGSANEGYDDDDVQAVLDSFLEDEEPKQPPRRDHHDDDGNGGSNGGENGATIEYLKVVSATIEYTQ